MSTNLDLSYFQDHLLQTENGLGDAMTHLSAVLAAAEVCIEQLVTLLLSVPNRFAYICTVFPEYSTMRNKIMNAFPTNPADLCTSFVRCLLIQFSTLFLVLPPNSFTEDGSRLVGQYKRYVMDAWPALSVLLAAINARPQKSSKAKRKTFFPKVNEVPLNNLGVVIPSNADEAGQLAAGILRTLNNILCFYFDLLSEPDLADFVRDAYFSGNDSFHLGSQRQTVHRAPEVHTDVDQSPSMPEIYPRLQPLKAALQVDNVEGFGQWDVIISSGATKDLKEIKRSDKERAEFVVNKIFQLSKGRFSGNNQRRLNGPSHGIPIYQAEVLSNLRIVYQIDCIPDDDGLTEHQVIKIYSIVTHKKLDHIWESLSNHLSKSKEYRERCNFRQRAPGTNTYIPTSFPRRQTDPDEDETHIIFNDDDLSQVCIFPFPAYLDDLISEEVQPSFQLTADEWEIVQSTTSCFVIGSSGTGKTTAMLYKMLEIHRAWQKTTGYPKPRQMFLWRDVPGRSSEHAELKV
ncbi:hypothetical protein ID866_7241 [Astraeus odoratus]|nr:hypothetical protein ID866_7241 [Astraeus odoratus]